MKLTWNLPRNCKNVFVSEVLSQGVIQPNVYLMTRLVTFFHSLLQSSSEEVQMMCRLSSRDLWSNLGSNLAHIREETGLDPWIFWGTRVRDALIQANTVKVAEQDEWKISNLKKLLSSRLEAHYSGNTETEENLTTLIHSLVST